MPHLIRPRYSRQTTRGWIIALVAAQACLTVHAQVPDRSEPQPANMPPALAQPQDVEYPGTIKLHVDATDVEHRVLRFREAVPVSPGPMVFFYSRWLPGYHAPNGPIYQLSGLKFSAAGQPLPWTRDPVDVYAFHIDIPAGITGIEIEATIVTPTESGQDRVVVSPNMLRLNWYEVSLYPAGHFIRRIAFQPSVSLPSGWQFATALEQMTSGDATTQFSTVSYETLVDSPLIAGRHFKRFPVDPNAGTNKPANVHLNTVADEAEQLDVKPEHLRTMTELVRQADKLFGARHYNHYDFLLWLSDQLGLAGIEHARSSENGVNPKYFTAWDSGQYSRDLLAHEYVHSWNGKFRRPADLWTANLNVPMRDSLLWVYEGQTQFWGWVLAARSGFVTRQQALEALAVSAATYQAQVGRTWRPLQDTTNDPIIANRRAIPWRAWQRSEDYYSEGALIWLDADTLIRQETRNKRSMDDFAREFFGMRDGDWGQQTYSFDDIVATLNKVLPHDWATFLRTRINDIADQAPLDGLTRGGYELVFKDSPTDYIKASEQRRSVVDLSFSIGAEIENKGRVNQVTWESAAYKAGLTVGTEIVAVNGRAFEPDRLRAAVKATSNGSTLELLIKQADLYRTVRIEYNGGLRYPQLQRLANRTPLLDDVFAPRK